MFALIVAGSACVGYYTSSTGMYEQHRRMATSYTYASNSNNNVRKGFVSSQVYTVAKYLVCAHD
jgi:hypothetical protein